VVDRAASKDGTVITLTRLNGQAFALNSDLIERIDATPDTVITLVDGTKYVVTESLAEVIREVREFRASVVALSQSIPPATQVEPAPEGPGLHVVHDAGEES
jgi:flagellar protein FlbD